MGRIRLIKYVICDMLSEVDFFGKIDTGSLAANFVRTGDIDSRKIVTVAWDKICTPFSEGGLGLCSLKSTDKEAMLKLTWEVVSSNYTVEQSSQ